MRCVAKIEKTQQVPWGIPVGKLTVPLGDDHRSGCSGATRHLARAPPSTCYGSEGWAFESLRARHESPGQGTASTRWRPPGFELRATLRATGHGTPWKVVGADGQPWSLEPVFQRCIINP